MTITFPEPIVNRAGPDIVLFEINAGTVADSCNVKINGVTVAVPTTVGAGGWGSTGYAVTSADVYSTSTTPATLSAVENGTLTLTSADVNQTVFGVAFDLSQFGVADGASVSSLTIWSTSTGSAGAARTDIHGNGNRRPDDRLDDGSHRCIQTTRRIEQQYHQLTVVSDRMRNATTHIVGRGRPDRAVER